jgi:hypothetical protein
MLDGEVIEAYNQDTREEVKRHKEILDQAGAASAGTSAEKTEISEL